jgi:thioredoxin 1
MQNLALRSLLVAFVLLVGLPASGAEAGKWIDYDAKKFSAAQKSGSPIVIDVFASWCPVCRQQKPILDDVAQLPALKGAMLMKVDFDVQKEFLREHRVARQSTILVFKGGKETVRSVAETDRERLTQAVLKGVK